ncbi:MAG: aminotransferase class V-fold PLP-dependent enzyme, partial [Allosphingosinicella sp.]
MRPPVYLDYQATTPVAPEVAAAMRPWIETGFANPHSSSSPGREAAAAIEVARDRVVSALEASATAGKLYFTSGATEAINWALKGAAARLPADRRRIVTLATEHAAVLDTVEWLAGQGFEVDILEVGSDGLASLERLAGKINAGTGLVAAMLVNNEIGIIQPIAEVAALARRHGALFLCDAVQGLGRVPLPLESCDLAAISAHKVHGPKGAAFAFVRDGSPVEPMTVGGAQEGFRRAGTEDVAAA